MTFPTAKQDADHHAARLKDNPQMQSPAYRLAYHDFDFMIRDELRPVRLQLELLKPELAFAEHGIESTIVIFGSARMIDAQTAQEQLSLANNMLLKIRQIPTRNTLFCVLNGRCRKVIITSKRGN